MLEELAELVLNADELTITDAGITPGWADADAAGEPSALSVSLDVRLNSSDSGSARRSRPGDTRCAADSPESSATS